MMHKKPMLSPRLLMVLFASLCTSCGGPEVIRPPHGPRERPLRQTCQESGDQVYSMIVDWDDGIKSQLESAYQNGGVVVRYSNCEITILSECHTAKTYQYKHTEIKSRSIDITDERSLYGSLSIGVANLKGRLERASQIYVDYAIAGQYTLESGGLSIDSLEGQGCSGATHVVTDLSVGALGYVVVNRGQVTGEAAVWGQGAGSDRSRTSADRHTDGTKSACRNRNIKDPEPPDGCRAIIGIGIKKILIDEPSPTPAPLPAVAVQNQSTEDTTPQQPSSEPTPPRPIPPPPQPPAAPPPPETVPHPSKDSKPPEQPVREAPPPIVTIPPPPPPAPPSTTEDRSPPTDAPPADRPYGQPSQPTANTPKPSTPPPQTATPSQRQADDAEPPRRQSGEQPPSTTDTEPTDFDETNPPDSRAGSPGFYFRVEFGPGGYWTNGSLLTETHRQDPVLEVITGKGGTMRAGVSLGAAVADNLFVGVTGSGVLGTNRSGEHPAKLDAGFVGPFLHFYADWLEGLSCGFEVGYADAVWSLSNEIIGNFSGAGFYFAGGLGMEWPMTDSGDHALGIGARVTYIRLSDRNDSDKKFDAILPSLVMQYTYF